jgi:aminopeptidase-like protein
VVDTLLKGELKDEIFIMAHTCHPGMVSDGIACIAVGNEIYHQLKNKKLKYSYRFIYGPEYWGGATWLEKNAQDTKHMKYGVFLDMLSTFEPIGFQESAFGDSRIDKIILNVLKSHTNTFLHRTFRKLWGNDETFYNGPGFNIPTIGIGRGMHREYHYNTDNLENMSLYKMEESCWILQRMIEVFETDFVPVLQYRGPLYLSRYGLFVDPYTNREGYDAMEKIQILADGKNSCFDIADKLNIDFFFVREFFEKLLNLGFCESKSYPASEKME